MPKLDPRPSGAFPAPSLRGFAPRFAYLAALTLLVGMSACSERPGASSRGAGFGEAVPVDELPGRQERMVAQELSYKIDRLDAALDGWQTEVVQKEASAQLKALMKRLEKQKPLEVDELQSVAVPEVRGEALRPAALEKRLERPGLEVWRLGEAPPASFEGLPGLASALEELRRPFEGAEALHPHLKLIRIAIEEDVATTEMRFEAFGASEGRPRQITATWELDWQLDEAGPPKIAGWKVASFDEILGPADGETLFVDQTKEVLSREPAFEAQLLPGKRYWGGHLDSALGADILGHHGLAVGDVNGDGLEDIYLAQAGGLPNRLLVQQEDGSVRDTAAEAGVDYLDKTTSALLLDLDNDGDQDLVTSAGPLIFHANDGKGTFEVATALQTFLAMSLAAADYDGDGDLDLYVTRYSSPEETAPLPYHDANNGLSNVLLRNEGDFRFKAVTEEVGLDENNRRFSFAAAWEDYDGDGDQDLYVANDFGRNNLYRNDDGTGFGTWPPTAGVEDISAGMSVTWGDADGDGDWDLYVSNMFSSAGSRITYQRQLSRPTPPRFGPRASVPAAMPGATRCSKTPGTGPSDDVSVWRPASPWPVGPGDRNSSTSTTTAWKTSTPSTATSPTTISTICEASSGGRSCRTHPSKRLPAAKVRIEIASPTRSTSKAGAPPMSSCGRESPGAVTRRTMPSSTSAMEASSISLPSRGSTMPTTGGLWRWWTGTRTEPWTW